jgi:hypothetical protein
LKSSGQLWWNLAGEKQDEMELDETAMDSRKRIYHGVENDEG